MSTAHDFVAFTKFKEKKDYGFSRKMYFVLVKNQGQICKIGIKFSSFVKWTVTKWKVHGVLPKNGHLNSKISGHLLYK